MSATPENTQPLFEGSTIDDNSKKSSLNKSKNRNRNRNKRKGNKTDEKTIGKLNSTDIENNDSKAKNPKDVKDTKKKGKKLNNKNNKSHEKPLFKELEKLIPIINPITVNGLSTKTLTTDILTFLKKIIDDKSNKDEIFMTFFLKPSDPDFPFDISLLTLTLCIPQTYPNKLPSPTIMILNDDIPRGYSVNIEIGFKKIVSTILANRQSKKKNDILKSKENEKKKNNQDNDKTNSNENMNKAEEDDQMKIDIVGGNDLLGMIKTLDKNLEKFLSMEKKDTIKLVKVINKQEKQNRMNITSKEKIQKGEKTPKHLKEVHSTINTEKYKLRKEEIDIFRQRLKENQITVASDNSLGTTYKMVLYFKDDNLTVEFDSSEEVTIEKLYVKVSVPKEYLSNPKKGIKLFIDMSNSYNIELLNSIQDTNIRLIFGKLINNINRNYDTFSLDIASSNCKDPNRTSSTFWTITSQLNFFVHNIQKFMNERADFQNWYSANKELNSLLLQSN